MRYPFLIVFFTLLLSFPSFAAATPSNASPSQVEEPELLDQLALSDRPDFYLQDMEDLDDDDILRGIYAEVLAISDSMDGPGATPSNASRSDTLEAAPSPSDGEEVDIRVLSVDAVPLAEADEDVYVNVLRFDITFNNVDYILLIPPEYIDSLYIDAQDRLWNMSTDTITGRIVDAHFDPAQDEGRLMYLTPCLGNNFNTIHEYGHPNYMRHYYWSGGAYDRLNYDTTYGTITVRKYYNPFYVSQSLEYIILFVLTGGVLFICLSNYRRY